jgi:hypothetical protein
LLRRNNFSRYEKAVFAWRKFVANALILLKIKYVLYKT